MIKIEVGPFKNWIMFSLLGKRVTFASGKHSEKLITTEMSCYFLNKFRISSRYGEITIKY